jgi:hypothetical protein
MNAMQSLKGKKSSGHTPTNYLEHLNGRLPIPVVHQPKLLLIRCICIASYIPAPTSEKYISHSEQPLGRSIEQIVGDVDLSSYADATCKTEHQARRVR